MSKQKQEELKSLYIEICCKKYIAMIENRTGDATKEGTRMDIDMPYAFSTGFLSAP